jgi:hypothetical protein
MWAAWVVATIALAGAAFMLRFLMALLREGPPSVCYWVVPMRRAPEKECHLKALRGIYFHEDCRAVSDGACCGELSENENHAKEKLSSGLIAVDVRPIAGLGWRTIHPKRGHIIREHRL